MSLKREGLSCGFTTLIHLQERTWLSLSKIMRPPLLLYHSSTLSWILRWRCKTAVKFLWWNSILQVCIRLPLFTLMICISMLSSLVEVSFINAAFITTALEMFYSTNVKHWFLFTFEIWSCIIVSLSSLFELRDIVNNLLTSFSWTAL